MAKIDDATFDAGLSHIITNGTRLHFCSAEPDTAGGIAAVTLGYKDVTLGAVGDKSPSGRKTTIPACTDVVGTGTGSATHWALTNGATATYLWTGSLSTSFSVVSGETFKSTAMDISFPDAVSE